MLLSERAPRIVIIIISVVLNIQALVIQLMVLFMVLYMMVMDMSRQLNIRGFEPLKLHVRHMIKPLLLMYRIPILPLNDGPLGTVLDPHKMIEVNSSGKLMIRMVIMVRHFLKSQQHKK